MLKSTLVGVKQFKTDIFKHLSNQRYYYYTVLRSSMQPPRFTSIYTDGIIPSFKELYMVIKGEKSLQSFL